MTDRYKFVLICKDCGNNMTFADDHPSAALGEPVRSQLEVNGRPERTIYKRMVMLWVPEVCPRCSNVKAVPARGEEPR